MASTSPSPNSSPATLPPISPATSSPPPPSNSSITTPPASLTQPNQTSQAPPPQSPTPPAPPPSPPEQPLPQPPATSPPAPPLTSPQLPTPASPPPSPNLPLQPPSASSPPQIYPTHPSPPPPPPPAKIPSSPPSNLPNTPPAKAPENSPPPQPTVPSPPSPPPSNDSIHPGSTLSPPAPTFISTHKPTSKSTSSSNITAITSSNAGGIKPRGAIAIGVTVGFFLVLSLLVMAIWFTRKRKRKGSRLNTGYIMPSPFITSSQSSDSSLLSPQESVHLATIGSGSKSMYSQDPRSVGNSRSLFTYEELAKATNGFSSRNLLGEGGFGSVYKGYLPDGREVAVKQLNIGGGQGDQEFKAEIEIISRVHHRHLVSLVGYCIYENQRLLVYDYVPNNTLHYHLHGKGREVVMDLETRVKVAAGAARGIAYLHEDCHPRIIHRDIKSSNILLDNNFDALVADFGLAKLTLDTYTHVTTRVMGTFGYVAPEYASSGKLSEKSDVYSFGVVLLELITGRKPVDSSRPVGQESLVEWARPLLKRALDDQDFDELVDPKLNNDFVKLEMFRMIEAAAACVRHLASKRPRMSQVVRALDSIFEISDLTNGMKPGQSEIYEAREHSAQIRILQRMAFGSQDYNSSEIFSHSQNSWRRL